MKARAYTDLIEIWTVAEVANGFGGYDSVPAKVGDVWTAKRTKGSGFLFQQFGLNDFKNPVIFSIRHHIEITEKNFIMWNGRKFFIKGIENVNLENVDLIIYADEA